MELTLQHVLAVVVLFPQLVVVIDGAAAPLNGQGTGLGHLQDAEVVQQINEGAGLALIPKDCLLYTSC